MGSDLDSKIREAQAHAEARQHLRRQRRALRERETLDRLEQRRAKRPPRFSFAEDADGFELHARATWWLWPAVGLATLIFVVLGRATSSVLGMWAWLFALPMVGIGIIPALQLGWPTHRYRVMRDGRAAVIGRDGEVRFVGTVEQLSLRYYGGEDRIIISMGDNASNSTDLSPVANRDVTTVQQFCKASGVELHHDPGDRSELLALGAEDDRIVRAFMIILLLIALTLLGSAAL